MLNMDREREVTLFGRLADPLYNMLKASERDMVVGAIAVIAKEGGKSA
jgi:molybdenum cofactor biosynthesis enzyme